MSEDTIIIKDNIRLKVEADDWKAAIKEAGQLLVMNKYIKEQYVEDMIKGVQDLGPYIVIVPHVAIAHSRPSENVLNDGISLITLKEAIEFGNKNNDPVDLVFAFCSKSQNSHLELLKDLAKILENEQKINKIRNSDDIDEVYKIINTQVGED